MRDHRCVLPVSPAHHRLTRELAALAQEDRSAFAAMALRTRSPDVLDALATLALPGARAMTLVALGRAIAEGLPLRTLEALPLAPDWASELAAVVALQVTDRGPDPLAAEGLWQWAGTVRPAQELPPAHRDLRAQVAWVAHGPDGAPLRDWIARPAVLGDQVRDELQADLANPWREDPQAASSAEWQTALARIFGPRVTGIRVSPGPGVPFDRLTATPDQSPHTVAGDRKVTVIMTAFQPGPGLLTAVRSIIGQTWQEWELLLVDDASGPSYRAMVEDVAALDERIQLIRLETNGGTYRARNAALRHVGSADFVTFHDSDDWSHPRRLERTLEPLRADPALVATSAWGVKARDDLQLTRPGYHAHSRMAASLVFRRDPVGTTLGFFDPVRKSADKEFTRRLAVAFPGRLTDVSDPVGMVRRGGYSLSASDHSKGWRHHARRHYHQAYQPWHSRIRRGKADAYLADGGERTFWAPARWLPRSSTDAAGQVEHLEVIFAADFSRGDASLFAPVLAAAGASRVGLLQLDSAVLSAKDEPATHPDILRLVARGKATWVYLDDEVTVSRVVVLDATVLHPGTDQRAAWAPHQLDLVLPDSAAVDHRAAQHRARWIFGVFPRSCD